MRPVNLADIEVAARVLMALAPEERVGVMADLIRRADTAERYRKQSRRAHPAFGTGTLMSAAQVFDAAARPLSLGRDELRAYALVIAALIAHDTDQSL